MNRSQIRVSSLLSYWVIGCICIAIVGSLVYVDNEPVAYALDNGLARTPPMGWNTWNKFGCNIDETQIKQMADAMVSTGMLAAGYQYLNLDDCWEGQRDGNGFIQPDTTRFPSGMKALGDYIHSKGLKFGLYSSIGKFTCATYIGSRDYETKDAQQYAAWGVDYLKMDDCYMDDAWSPDFDRIIVNGINYEAEAATRTGSADIQNCSGCSGGQKAGTIGNADGTLNFNNVSVPQAGQYVLTIYYSDGSTYQEQKSRGFRTAYINVNGIDPADRFVFTPTGDWAIPAPVTVTVTLNAGSNQIKFYQPKTLREIYIERYSIMRDALAATGRSIIYSLCNQGALAPWEWSAPIGHLWRTTEDIQDNWDNIMGILDINSQYWSYAKPGAWNDPDLLEVGNGGMTDNEYQTHFSLWALMAAPLIAGNDLRTMSGTIQNILTNAEVIAVNQDSLGRQGSKVWESGSLSVWSKPLTNSQERAVILFNRGTGAANITAQWSDIGIAAGPASVRNLWSHSEAGVFINNYTVNVPAHGVVMLKVRSVITATTPSPTLTLTPSPTFTFTFTPSPTPSPTVTRPPSNGDQYEVDDLCGEAQSVPTDGTVQQRTLHKDADVDWAIFNAVSGTSYLIEAQVPPDSPADLEVEVRAACEGVPTVAQNWSYAPGIRIKFTAPADGLIRLKLRNGDASVFGNHVAYHLSVTAISSVPTHGAVIIVAGRIEADDLLQPRIYNVTDAVYRTFQLRGYTAERIYYLISDLSRPGADAVPSIANLQSAIMGWALDKVSPEQPLTIYMMDHGGQEKFYLDGTRNEVLAPQQLNDWLNQLEAARPGLKVNIIIEACFSGSFIRQPNSISKTGRVVITSASDDHVAWASQTGAEFSDRFLASLNQGQSLFDAYSRSKWAVETAFVKQKPFLDDNGDGVPNTPQDGSQAQRRGFTYAGTFDDVVWPPYIKHTDVQTTSQANTRIISVNVLDDKQVRGVYARIYPPDYQSPSSQEQLIAENIPTVPLVDQGHDTYRVTYPQFTQLGSYRVVIFAEDTDNNAAQPISVFITNGRNIYLPISMR